MKKEKEPPQNAATREADAAKKQIKKHQQELIKQARNLDHLASRIKALEDQQ